MAKEISEQVRAVVAPFILKALKKAIAHYKKFITTCPHTDSKIYKAHQDACRSALAHITLLLNIEERTQVDKTEQDDAVALADMLAEAQKKVDAYDQSLLT